MAGPPRLRHRFLTVAPLRSLFSVAPSLTVATLPHTEFAPDRLHIDRTALVGGAGVARDDEQRGIARQCSDHVLRDAVCKKLLLRIGAHIGEGAVLRPRAC